MAERTLKELTADFSDYEVVCRTIYGEARTYPWEVLRSIAWVIRNRAKNPRWWGRGVPTELQTLRNVCLQDRQFSCWNHDDINRPILLKPLDELHPKPAYQECMQAASQVLFGDQPGQDPTNAADHYLVNRLVGVVGWTKGKKPCAVVGPHTFYRLEIPAHRVG